jgi:hypothetical protein
MSVSKSSDFSKAEKLPSNFFNALILSAVAGDKSNASLGIKKRLAKFVLSQIKENGAVNYWAINSKISKDRPYPDDLDDTFCSYAALSLYDKSLVDGTMLANVVKLLTALEIEEGGPYRTWLVSKESKKEWLDVDLVVNSNVAYFLKQHGITLPNLDGYIEKCIKQKKLSSPYYLKDSAIYFLSRVTETGIKVLLKELLNERFEGLPLQSVALLLTSLINLGYRGEKVDLIARYLALQASKMPIVAAPFHVDQVINGKPQYGGSGALTASLVLEAISKYEALSLPSNKQKIEPPRVSEVRQYILKNLESLEKRFPVAMAHALRQEYLPIIGGIHQDEIMLLPYLTYSMLDPEFKSWEKYSETVKRACLLGVLGWTAYRGFDDFMDSQAKPERLPLAVVYFREMQNIIQDLGSNFFQEIFDEIDTANFWELTRCNVSFEKTVDLKSISIPNFGDYSVLANKSIGHCLGSMIVYDTWLRTSRMNEPAKNKALSSLKKFFLHYIIARQMSDDLHDWKADLKSGRLNCVSAWLIKELKKKNKKAVSSKKLLDDMQSLYWDKGLSFFAKKMLKSLREAERSIEQCPETKSMAVMLDLLQRYKGVADKSLEESKRAKQFLKTYAK